MTDRMSLGGVDHTDELPDMYEKIRAWTIHDLVDDWMRNSTTDPSKHILYYIVGTFAATGVLVAVTVLTTPFPEVTGILYSLLNVLMLFLTIGFHELCHGSVIVAFGGRPKFGGKWMEGMGPVVYATAKGYFSVGAYKIVALTPLILISVICVIALIMGFGWWTFVPFFFNAIGAGGDLLSYRVLRRYPANYFVEDTEDGFRVFGKMKE